MAPMDHAHNIQLAYTESVKPHVVTRGVNSVWYPISKHFNNGFTSPLRPRANNWTVLLRATATTTTSAVTIGPQSQFRPGAPCATDGRCTPRSGEAASPLFAVRDFGRGRVAIISQLRQFSMGAGSAWVYDNQTLSRGAQGRRSDMGRLLRQCLRWLAAPSFQNRTSGGFKTIPSRWLPPNLGMAGQFKESLYGPYDARTLDQDPAKLGYKIYKGLIGAKTSLSDGTADVAAYAAAAKASGLSFVVFLESFAMDDNRTLGQDELEQLEADCVQHSDKDIQLFPGYTIETQFGNDLMVFANTGGQKRRRCSQVFEMRLTALLVHSEHLSSAAGHADARRTAAPNCGDRPGGRAQYDWQQQRANIWLAAVSVCRDNRLECRVLLVEQKRHGCAQNARSACVLDRGAQVVPRW